MELIDLNQIKKERIIFDKKGKYLVYFKNLSGQFYFEIKTKEVNLLILGVFFGRKDEEFKIKTYQHHQVGESKSVLIIKGVFDNFSRFFYEGVIRIEKEAQKTYAALKNQNLLLSNKVKVEAKPYLEILNNDVFCAHAVSCGQLNDEKIYYLQTRGLSKKQAKEFLIESFINEIEIIKKYNKSNYA